MVDLNELPYTWAGDEEYDEIHAYDVLEHLGTQGDWKFFFAQFAEFYRMLKPDGLIAGSCPDWRSQWAWGDPSHTRVINQGTLTFLDQTEYEKQVGNTPMTDFRFHWKGNFKIMGTRVREEAFEFLLKAVK